MTNGTAHVRAGRIAMLAVALSLIVGAAPVRAASAIEIQAQPLVGGRYEIGGWLGISVTLVNQGAPTDGYLSAETEGGSVRRFVEMPAGARKVVTLYVEPAAFQRTVDVTYTEPNGSVTASTEVRVLEQTRSQIAIVGDTTASLRPQLLAAAADGRPEPINLTVFELPERPEPLAGIASIVWVADSTSLSEGQRSSLERWVADGGRLIVIGGADWQTRAGGLVDLLPVESLAARDGASLGALAAWAGADAPPIEEATISSGPLRNDAREIVAGEEGDALASMRTFGAGYVVLIGADLATDAFRGWDGAPALWNRLIPSSAAFEQFFGGAPPREEVQGSMNGALSTLPTLQVPPAELLLAVIVGYILLIGPISYIVLRRIDRRELAWVTAPILIVLFSACSYGIGRAVKGSDVIVNQVAVVHTSPTGAALAETYAGVFSPDRSTYSLTVDGDVLLGSMPTNSFDGTPVSGQGNAVIDQGRPAHLSELSIGAFGFAGVHASGLADAAPGLTVTWSTVDGEIVGVVTNESDTTIADVAYVSSTGGVRIGDLSAGASEDFGIPGANFNGTSASDQVYGFGGFDTGSAEQRRIALRRQVIDALVGFGGWAGMEFAPSVGRGPYVIGWREDEGPMPITVDDVAAQRHVSMVEVVSVRPTLGTGEITVPPAQMSVSVSETEGDVVGFDPGSFSIVDGSITFRLGLPLEASGLEASSVRIIVGPDAGTVLGEQGGFQGFWPQGFVAEVRHPETGAWTLLGDLSQESSFTIDDPASVLSRTGLIDVRVSGSTNQDFGPSSVFVSAAVSGVLDR